MRLYSLTAKEHPDHHDLRDTIFCVGSVSLSRWKGKACVYRRYPYLTPTSSGLLPQLIFDVLLLPQMVQAREHQLNQNQNEIKLEQVQVRFPHDNLNLFQPLDVIEVSLMGVAFARKGTRLFLAYGTPTAMLPIPTVPSEWTKGRLDQGGGGEGNQANCTHDFES